MSIINVNEDLENLKIATKKHFVYKKKIKDFLTKISEIISKTDNFDIKFEYDLNILPLEEWIYFLKIFNNSYNKIIKKKFFKDVIIKIYDSNLTNNITAENFLNVLEFFDENNIKCKFNVFNSLDKFVYSDRHAEDIIEDLFDYYEFFYNKPIDENTTIKYYNSNIYLELDISKISERILLYTFNKLKKNKRNKRKSENFFDNFKNYIGNITYNTRIIPLDSKRIEDILKIADLLTDINLDNKIYINFEFRNSNDFESLRNLTYVHKKNIELNIINLDNFKNFFIGSLIDSSIKIFLNEYQKIIFGLKNYNINFDIDIDFIKNFEFSKFIQIINLIFNYNEYKGERNSNFKINLKEFNDGIDLSKLKIKYSIFDDLPNFVVNEKVKFYNINLEEKVKRLNVKVLINYITYFKDKLVNEKEINISELTINYNPGNSLYFFEMKSTYLYKIYNILKSTKINNRFLNTNDPLKKLILIASENKEYKYEKINSNSFDELNKIIEEKIKPITDLPENKLSSIFNYFYDNNINPFKFRSIGEFKIKKINYTYIIDLARVVNRNISEINLEVCNNYNDIIKFIKKNYPFIKKINFYFDKKKKSDLVPKNKNECSKHQYELVLNIFEFHYEKNLFPSFNNYKMYGEFDFTNFTFENYIKYCENKINNPNSNIIKKFINKKKISTMVKKIKKYNDKFIIDFVDKILQLFRFRKNKDNVYTFYNEDMIYKKYNINLKGKWTKDRYIKELKEKHDFCYRDNFNSPELALFKKNIANNIKYGNPITYVVNRENLLDDLIKTYFQPSKNIYQNDFYKRSQLYIKYINEPGIDQGGITRMFYNDLANEIKTSKYFTKIDDKCNYYTVNLNNNYEEDDESIKNYEAIGSLVGLCIQRRKVLNIRFDPLLLLILIEDFDIFNGDVDIIIKKLENYDENIFDKVCPVYYNLKNISKLNENEWNDILNKKLENPLTEVENEYYVSNHMEINKKIDRLKAIKFKDVQFNEKPPKREENESIKSFFKKTTEYRKRQAEFLKNKKELEDKFENENDYERKEYTYDQKKERLSDWIVSYIKPNYLKIGYFASGFNLSFSDNYKNKPKPQEDLSIRELNFMIMGIDKINFKDFEDWIRKYSKMSDRFYINKLIKYVKSQSDKSNTYLNTLWQTISGSRNLSIQGFPEGVIRIESDVDYDFRTTTCSNYITFNKAIFDDLDSYLSEEKLIEFNKGKTTIGGGGLIKNLTLLNKNNKLKIQKTSNVKNNLKKLSKLKIN
jgi:hypothetical protein